MLSPHCLFQPLSDHNNVIVAVSGGSDSVALACLLQDWLSLKPDAPIVEIVTIDHGLRAESATEAAWVDQFARSIGLPHHTSRWISQSGNASADDARLARYQLLTQRAIDIGATAILLGHTMDDQAETVLMRALRMTDMSETRGLSGMSSRSSYDGITLLRPLLDCSREGLRTYLNERQQSWIDDPTNLNRQYERVRVRQALAGTQDFPSQQNLARLATLSNRSKTWMNSRVSEIVTSTVRSPSYGVLVFEPPKTANVSILSGCFALLVQIVGGQRFRTPQRKFLAAVNASLLGKKLRLNAGHCLISVTGSHVTFEPEVRRNFRHSPHSGLTVQPMEKFRSESDDSLYQSAQFLVQNQPNQPPRST